MIITTLAELLALPGKSVVLDDQDAAWQSSEYNLGDWFAPGCEIESTAAELLEIGPLRLIHKPDPTENDIEAARRALWDAQAHFDRLCNEAAARRRAEREARP